MLFRALGVPIILSFIIFISFMIMIYLVLMFILYIFKSFGLFYIAKNSKIKQPYFSWIPFLSNYVVGYFALNDKKKPICYALLSLFTFILCILSLLIDNLILFFIAIFFILVYYIIDMIVMNYFYKKAFKKHEIYLILTIITFGILKPLFIYAYRIKLK